MQANLVNIMSKAKKRYNFENKKSIHTTMSLGTHSEFRIKLLKKGLSMQEVLEECAVRIAGQDSYMDKMLDELVERKITGERKIAESDAQSLYRLIEAEDEE